MWSRDGHTAESGSRLLSCIHNPVGGGLLLCPEAYCVRNSLLLATLGPSDAQPTQQIGKLARIDRLFWTWASNRCEPCCDRSCPPARAVFSVDLRGASQSRSRPRRLQSSPPVKSTSAFPFAERDEW